MWLVTAVSTLVAWLLALALCWVDTQPFTLGNWLPPVGNGAAVIYQLDEISWPYYFALSSLAVAVVLTSAVWFRSKEEANPWAWGGILVITAAGMVAVLSGSPLSLILSWTMLDVIDLVFLLWTPSGAFSNQVVLLFSSRLCGTLVAGAALVVSAAAGNVMTFAELPASAGLLLLFAAGLRLGVIPLHLPYTKEEGTRRGVGTVMRLVTPGASLVILGRLPAAVVPPNWAYLFLAFTSLAALYGAAMWTTSKNELAGRPYWLICLAGMAVGCSIRGQPSSAPVWGVIMVLGGGMTFLHTLKQYRTLYAALLFILLSGLPFTPAAVGWSGLIVYPISILDFVLLISHSVFLFGTLYHSLRGEREGEGIESWSRLVYFLGLALLFGSVWAASILVTKSFRSTHLWWASGLSAVLAVTGVVYFFFRKKPLKLIRARSGWMGFSLSKLWTIVAGILSLRWLYQFMYYWLQFLKKVVDLFSTVLEGEGGVLWTLVLLVLMVTIFSQIGGQ